MKDKKRTFLDTFIFLVFFISLSSFAAFIAMLVYFLRLLGVR